MRRTQIIHALCSQSLQAAFEQVGEVSLSCCPSADHTATARARGEDPLPVTASLAMSVFFLSSLRETISEQLFDVSVEWSIAHPTKGITGEL